MGIVIGYFTLRTNSLYVGILIHIVNNLLAILVSLWVDLMSPSMGMFVTHVIFILYLILGLIGFLLLSKRYKNIFYISGSRSKCSNREKCKWFASTTPMLFALALIFCFMLTSLTKLQ